MSDPPHRFDLFGDLPESLAEEYFEVLAEGCGWRLERILSQGHGSPEGFWYDQEWHEWVLLLRGEAMLALEDQTERVHLVPGKGILLPAHCRHRVEWTAADRISVWLALHYDPASGPPPIANLLQQTIQSGEKVMSAIRIERQISAERQQELGVRNWPTWSAEPSEFPWTYDAAETAYVLEGHVIVTPEGG